MANKNIPEFFIKKNNFEPVHIQHLPFKEILKDHDPNQKDNSVNSNSRRVSYVEEVDETKLQPEEEKSVA